jgi:hypothetical protein
MYGASTGGPECLACCKNALQIYNKLNEVPVPRETLTLVGHLLPAWRPGLKVDRMIGVYCGSRRYVFDSVEVLPVADFVKELFAGEVF